MFLYPIRHPSALRGGDFCHSFKKVKLSPMQKNERDSIFTRQESQAIKSLQFAFIAGDLVQTSTKHGCARVGL